MLKLLSRLFPSRRPDIEAAMAELGTALGRYRRKVLAAQSRCPHARVIATQFAGMPRWGRLCLDCGLEEHANSPHGHHPNVYWPGDDTKRRRRLSGEFVKGVDYDEFVAARIPHP